MALPFVCMVNICVLHHHLQLVVISQHAAHVQPLSHTALTRPRAIALLPHHALRRLPPALSTQCCDELVLNNQAGTQAGACIGVGARTHNLVGAQCCAGY